MPGELTTGQLSRADATLAPAVVAAVVGASVDDRICGSWAPSPSPDGTTLAFVSDRGGAPAVWLQRVPDASAEPGAVVVETGPHPVVGVHWSPDGAWIACEIAPGGAPRCELWLVRPDGTELRQVAGFGATNAIFGTWSLVAGNAVLAVTESSTLLLIDPATGLRRTLGAGNLRTLLDVHTDGQLALVRRGPRGQRQLTVASLQAGACRELAAGPGVAVSGAAASGAAGSTDRGVFTADGTAVFARSDAGSELARLVSIPLDGGPATLIAGRCDAELDDFAVSADGATVALLWNTFGGRSELTLLDVATKTERCVTPAPGPVMSGVAISVDGSTVVVCAEGTSSPRTIYRVAVRTGEAAPVGAPVARYNLISGARRAGAVVVEPQLHRLVAEDGLIITGWLYQPHGCGPHPTMVSLHAGPEAQERPGYNPLFQDLVGQGIAVFAPNVRGSSGFGRTFVNADNGAGRHGAIADVAACVAYLVSTGVAEAGRIGCMGRSYGGYLTLAALVTYPELFAVGVDVCGMADFATFFARTEPWIADAAVSKYGHPERDAALLRELSPLHKLDRLAAPLLVVHGGNDSNVPVYEADQVVWALHERGAPYRYILFPDEGHEFLLHANRRTYVAETVGWVAHHLGVTAPTMPRLAKSGGV